MRRGDEIDEYSTARPATAMSMNPDLAVTIVGAGVAGLTIAHQLCPHRRVTVIEALPTVGGLGRSWHYGDFHFDVGPHRFHTENPRVAAFIASVLGEDGISIPRKSGARMFGRFHEWPLRPSVLFKMPLSVMWRAARDLITREKLTGESFEADIVNKYGRTLYDIFFEPYTRKFLFHSPADLHRDWGRAGVNRAVIDQRASANTLWGVLRTTLLPQPVDTTFLYSPYGVGRFSEILADRVNAMGGSVRLGHPVCGIEAAADRVVAVRIGDARVEVQNLVWSGPLTMINRMLGITSRRLRYLSTIFFNIELACPLHRDYQWIYFGGDEIFSRVSAPTAFAATMAPPGTSGLCVEVTCLEGDDRWRDPEQLTAEVVKDLVRTGTIARAEDVRRVHIELVRDTYPIYTLDYLEELSQNFRALARYRNLLLAGRSARFWYNNMDHSIGQGLTMSDKILKGTILNSIDDSEERQFWQTPPA